MDIWKILAESRLKCTFKKKDLLSLQILNITENSDTSRQVIIH